AEAGPPGADGPRLPRPEADRAPDGAGQRAAGKDRAGEQDGGRRGSAEKTGPRPGEAGQTSERRQGGTVGQKGHPFRFRLGFNKTWRSRWYANRDYAKLLHEDLDLRQTLKKRFAHAGVSKIETERAVNRLKIDIYTSRPGIIIGRKGTEVDKLKQEIQK